MLFRGAKNCTCITIQNDDNFNFTNAQNKNDSELQISITGNHKEKRSTTPSRGMRADDKKTAKEGQNNQSEAQAN